jgi:hypothetical protein
MKPWFALLALGAAALPALRADEPPATTITCRGPMETVSTDTETTITLRDQVEADGNGTHLECDFLKVVVIRQKDPAATIGQYKNFKSLLATGHVTITNADRVGTCGRAEVFPDQDRIILSENAAVRFIGEKTAFTPGPHGRIIFNTGQRDAIMEPAPGESIHGVLPPLRNLGFAPGAKPAPAAPAAAP